MCCSSSAVNAIGISTITLARPARYLVYRARYLETATARDIRKERRRRARDL
jgi:hypothetical protein